VRGESEMLALSGHMTDSIDIIYLHIANVSAIWPNFNMYEPLVIADDINWDLRNTEARPSLYRLNITYPTPFYRC
jgi:hypothetical protein